LSDRGDQDQAVTPGLRRRPGRRVRASGCGALVDPVFLIAGAA